MFPQTVRTSVSTKTGLAFGASGLVASYQHGGYASANKCNAVDKKSPQRLLCSKESVFSRGFPDARPSRNKRQAISEDKAVVSCLESVPQRGDPCTVACIAIGTTFEKALEELIHPRGHDGGFIHCRELITAVVFSRSHGIPANVLIKRICYQPLYDHETTDAALSELHRQIVQPFIRHVYAVDNLFTKRDRSCGKGCTLSGDVSFTSAQLRRYIDMERAVRRGVPDSLMCLQTYVRKLIASMSSDAIPQVPTRHALPRVWEDILVVLVLTLRMHLEYGDQ